MAVGYGNGEMYLGSDAIALAPFTDTISYLEDGDWAMLVALLVAFCAYAPAHIARGICSGCDASSQ